MRIDLRFLSSFHVSDLTGPRVERTMNLLSREPASPHLAKRLHLDTVLIIVYFHPSFRELRAGLDVSSRGGTTHVFQLFR
jgi:hypothetical protein